MTAALNDEQLRVLQLVRDGRSVFFTGRAGTGKTLLLSHIIAHFRERYGRLGPGAAGDAGDAGDAEAAKHAEAAFRCKVAVTAMTGVAATHLEGMTLNAALGLGAPSMRADFRGMLRSPARQRIQGWDVLIIDECSMMSAEFVEEMDEMLCAARGNAHPAGGLQVIVAGDFMQLPPISRPLPPTGGPGARGVPRAAFLNHGYAFQAPAWRRWAMEHVMLRQVYRQQGDGELLAALDAIRQGHSKASRAALRSLIAKCARPLTGLPAGIVPTLVFARNRDVDQLNEQELRRLVDAGGARHVLTGTDDVVVDAGLRARLNLASAAPCLPRAGDSPSSSSSSNNPFARFACAGKDAGHAAAAASDDDDPDDAEREQAQRAFDQARQRLQRSDFFRDCLAGATLQLCVGAQVMLLRNLDVPRGRVNGSRGMVVDFVPRASVLAGSCAAPVAGALDAVALRSWRGRLLPLVRFTDGEELVVAPSRFSSVVPGTGECVRVQVPLKLAWAITVHKSQGMSLDAVRVSLGNTFAVGQAYVALSRARSLQGLQIVDWDPDCVRSDTSVVAFYGSWDGESDRTPPGEEDWWTAYQRKRDALAAVYERVQGSDPPPTTQHVPHSARTHRHARGSLGWCRM